MNNENNQNKESLSKIDFPNTEIKKLKEELNLFKAIADYSCDFEQLISENGDSLYISPSCEKITGYPPNKFYENHRFIEEITIDEDKKIVHNHFFKKNHNESLDAKIEFRILTKEKKIKWIEHLCQKVYNSDGKLIGYRASNRDITKRKEEEEKIIHLNKTLEIDRNLFTLGNVVIFKWKNAPDWPVEYVSDNVKDILGYTSSEINSPDFKYSKLIHKEDIERVAEEVYHHSTSGLKKFSHKPYRLITKNNRIIWVSDFTNIIRNETGIIEYYYGFLVDITDLIEKENKLNFHIKEYSTLNEEYKSQNEALKIAKEKAEDNEKKYKLLIENQTDLIVKVDTKGKFLFASPSFCKIINKNESELIGKEISEYIFEDDLVLIRKKIEKLYKNKLNTYIELKINTTKGVKCIAWVVTSVIDSENKINEIIGVGRDITEKKIIDDKLKERERQLSTLMSNLPGMAYKCLNIPTWDMLFVSDGCINLTGFSNNELLSNNPSYGNIIFSDDQKYVWDTVQNSIINKTTFELQYRIIDKSKQIKWVWEKGQGVYDKSGNLITLEGFVTDISKLKNTEKELKIFKESLENSTVAIGMATPEGMHYYQNKAFVDLFGNLGFSDPKKVYLDQEIAKQVFETIKKGENWKGEVKMITKDGIIKDIALRAYANFNEKGEINALVGIHTDITERKKNIEKLRISQERYDTVMGAINDGLWDWDISSNKVYFDERYYTMAGYEPNEFEGKFDEFTKHLHPDDVEHVLKSANDHFSGITKVFDIEYRFRRKEGIYMWIRGRGKIVKRDENGNPLRMIGTHTDINDKKNAELEIIKAKNRAEKSEYNLKLKNDEYEALNEELTKINEELKTAKEKAEESNMLKSAFLQNLSHEIRTPINAIMGFAGFLSDPETQHDKIAGYASIIQNSSNQLLSIINDILTISAVETKQEKARIEKINVNNILVELQAIYKQQLLNKNISLYLNRELSDNKAEIYTDKTKLTQIITNLLSNAVKFTSIGSIEFGYRLKNDFLEFFVKDTGIGIKKEHHQAIFERFRQADKTIQMNFGGTGLGLAISKGFVELLGGEIWVESEPEKGAKFLFTIPYNPIIDENNSDEIINPISDKKTILIAEDQEFNFLFLEEILKDNYKLLHAKNGKDAVEICLKYDNISLVLIDIKMPVMDGYEASKIIKQQKPDLKIIAVTAYALDNQINDFIDIFDEYLVKPIDKKSILEIISKYTDL